ncbi:MAG: hypothetical protein KatS3mg098_420 [Candidatus Parcubacteria bacterium]|nr:MAG: hypothetical protein KatS3mg098_420 [Candidatus Parcubacteria bacterium]
MIIFVKAKPHSKKEIVERKGDNLFEVKVKALPQKGEANKAIAQLLANYFNIPLSKIKLVAGKTNRNKIYEIKTD